MTPCGHWTDGAACGTTDDVDRYLVGPRCRAHSPAALAGRVVPTPDPAATVEGLRHRTDLPVTSVPYGGARTDPPSSKDRGARFAP